MARVVRKSGAGKARLAALQERAADAHVRVGWLETAVYPNTGTPVALVAMAQEHGREEKNIPPRPTMGPTAAAQARNWAALVRGLAGKVARGELDIRQVLAQLGARAESDVRAAIDALTSPELHAGTVLARVRKKSKAHKAEVYGAIVSLTKPLRETDQMRELLDYQVGDGKGPVE